MRRGVFGHAVTRRRRGVNYQLIGCFGLQRARLRGWLRNWRTRCGRRRSRQLLAEFHQTPADEKTVDEESNSDQERDYSCHPQPTNDLRINAGFLSRHNVEEEVEKDHYADADQTGNDPTPNLIEPLLFLIEQFLFGSEIAQPPQLFRGIDHFSPPGLAPIELLAVARGQHRVAHVVQFGAALLAEFEIIADLNTASGTEHNQSSLISFRA